MAVRQIIPVACPSCGARYSAPLESIIDVGQNPDLKAPFLQGRLNTAICPRCGARGNQLAPVFYHDPAKELALVLIPSALSLAYDNQQKLIGTLTNQVMSNLPTEQRKMYLFDPKVFLTMESLVKAVLAADGITQEVIDRQTEKIRLIEQFLQAGDEATLKKLAEENANEMDYEFFEVLTASAHAAQMEGNAQAAQTLLALRQHLAGLAPQGLETIKQVDAALGVAQISSREDLLERLQEVDSDEEFRELIAAGRPLLDYAFFQQLTAQIDAAAKAGNADEAANLKTLRGRILDVNAEIDRLEREALNKASRLLSEILQAQDPEQAVRDRLEQIDSFVFAVLSMNIEEAARRGQKETAEALQNLGDLIMAVLEEKLPPEIRLINQLLQAAYPAETQNLLAQNKKLITPQFLEALENVVAQMQSSGQAQLAEHLAQVKEQARVLQQGILQK